MVSEHCRLAKGGHVCTMNSWATCMSQKIRHAVFYHLLEGYNCTFNKNALNSIESCLLGDKIRNEQAIRPRACMQSSFFPQSHVRQAKK